MKEWANILCVYLVLGMGIGGAAWIALYIWWKVFDELLKLFKCKKEFVRFVRYKREENKIIVPDTEKAWSK